MTALVKYKYLGLSSVVEVDYPTPQVKLDLHGPTPGTYIGLDRFGRVIDHRWINYDADEDIARIQHGYDRNSNRLWRQNDVARALSKKFDHQYTYDGLNRLTDAKTGLLNGSHVIPSGGDTAFQQKWSLDYVGNWSCFKQDNDGEGTFDLEQTRITNPVNEITNIGATVGPVWTTPQYDRAGNAISFPKPSDPTESFTAIYDAWNRMVRVIDNETDDIVQENVYDGRNFRVIKKTYDAGVLDETRHIYYTSNWQAIEERLGSSPDSADAIQQYVWGIRYIDDLVLRDRDTSEPPDNTLDERLYALQDPNWNVTAIIDDDGNVQERYEYDPYGNPTILDDDWDPGPYTLFQWDILYAGYHRESLSGLYLVCERSLDSMLGMWLQRDSLEYEDGLSLYQYVRSNPIAHLDPQGMADQSTIDALEELGRRLIERNRELWSMTEMDKWDPKTTNHYNCLSLANCNTTGYIKNMDALLQKARSIDCTNDNCDPTCEIKLWEWYCSYRLKNAEEKPFVTPEHYYHFVSEWNGIAYSKDGRGPVWGPGKASDFEPKKHPYLEQEREIYKWWIGFVKYKNGYPKCYCLKVDDDMLEAMKVRSGVGALPLSKRKQEYDGKNFGW